MGLFFWKNQPAIESLFASIVPYFNAEIQPTTQLISLKMQEAVMALLQVDERFYPTLFDFAELWKIDIIAFMNENYMYDLSLSEIASYTGRSLATFKRDFIKIFGTSPARWLKQKRLEEAHYLIVEKGEKPKDIYLELGFENLSHFYKVFKQQFGFSPKQVK